MDARAKGGAMPTIGEAAPRSGGSRLQAQAFARDRCAYLS